MSSGEVKKKIFVITDDKRTLSKFLSDRELKPIDVQWLWNEQQLYGVTNAVVYILDPCLNALSKVDLRDWAYLIPNFEMHWL